MLDSRRSNTQTVARNSLWYGLELACGIITAFATSIPLARAIGPEKLGYFNYVAWLTSLSAMIGGLGLAAATRKYMAECLNDGRLGAARAIFSTTFRFQLIATSVIVGGCLVIVFAFGAPSYRAISTFLVLSLFPAMLVTIPAQANVGAETMRMNTLASMSANVVHICSVALSLHFGWDLLGIAIGVLTFRTLDFGIKWVTAWNWIRRLPVEPLPASLRSRLINFSSYNLLLMVLNVVVWDRSDIVFLKALSGDIAQVSFYTVAFNLTEKIQLLPSAFTGAMGASIQAQFGRDKARLPQIMSGALWYTFLCGLPLMVGMAALSGHLIPLLYGIRYSPAAPVLAVGALFAVLRCHMPAWNVLEAMEKQRFLTLWMCGAAASNILLDIWLIPRYGALGAAFANGSAQMLAAAGVVIRAKVVCRARLRLASAARGALAAALMASVVVAISQSGAGGPLMVPIQVIVGGVVFLLALRAFMALNLEDRERLLQLQSAVPVRLRERFCRSVRFLIPCEVTEAIR
jgi:O-antigen/teichoic acid export membrane protein